MFGERFLATRQRLTNVVLEVRKLGIECGADLAALADEEKFLKNLSRPFLFLACGEVNSGKSTLLNGLFGEEVCPVSSLPQTREIEWFKWSSKSASRKSKHGWTVNERRNEFLKEFNLIDTPGLTNPSHCEVIEKLVFEADLLLFVFPVGNPWAAETWEILAKLPDELLQRTAMVLQQSDLREADDLKVIMEHMRTLAEQKLGTCPPIFPVSGKMALEARSTTPTTSHILHKSGFPPLERFIDRCVNGNRERREVLRQVCQSTQETLRQIEQLIEQRRQNLDRDQRFLQELEGEVEVLRESQSRLLGGRLDGLGEVFLKQGNSAAKSLSGNLSVPGSFLSLFRQETIPSTIERDLTEAVEEAVEEKAAIDGTSLSESCLAHWETAEPRLRENLEVDPPEFKEGMEALSETRKRFVEGLGDSSKGAVAQLKIRSTLDLQLESRRAVLRIFLGGCLSALIVAGICGGLGWSPWSWVAVALALFSLLIGGIFAAGSRKSLAEDFEERMKHLRQPFAELLADDYRTGVREFYVEYGGLFEIVRRRIADQKLLLIPRQERWNDLFLELKAIEQEI